MIIDEFAQQQGSSIAGNIDLSGVNFELTNLDYQQSVEIPSTGVSFTSIFRNATGNTANQTVEINNEKTLSTTITTENQTSLGTTQGVEQNSSFSVSNTVTASASVGIGAFEAGVENSLEIGAEYGVSTNLEQTFGQVLTQSQSETESQTSGITETNSININPQSVLYNNILTYTGTSDVPITMSYSVGGDFEFKLENEDDPYIVPINAVLQHYDLQDGQLDTFQPAADANLEGTDFDGNGTSVFYADTLNFDLVGSLELESTLSETTTNSVTDVLLNGSLLNGNSLAGLEIIRDEFGAPQQVRYTASIDAERLWIVQDSLTSNMQHDLITGYGGNDQIGISHSQIDAIDDLTIDYSGGNADIHFGEQHLARINGVDPNSLDSSDFVFSTVGTIFEDTRVGISSNEIDSFDDLDISYSNGNADIQFEGETLTTLSGVEPNSLDSSDFVFETEGTALDSAM